MTRPRIFLGWFISSALLLVPMLAHTSEPATVFGRYSPTYVVMLCIMLGATIAAGLGYALARMGRLPTLPMHLPQSRTFAWAVVAGGTALLGLMWLFLPGSSHLPPMILFRLYLAALIFAGMLILLRASGTFGLLLSERWSTLLVIALITLAVALTALYVGQVPPSRYFDEAWVANWGWTLFTTGEARALMFPRRPLEYSALATWLPLPALGAWLNVTGVTLEMARLFWLFLGWLGAPFIYLTAHRLYGKVAALFALALACILPLSHDYVRADMFVSTTVAAALYCLVRARDTGSLRWHFAVGVLAAMAVEGHQYGARFAFVFGFVYLVDYLWLLWKERRWQWNPAFWAYVAGGLSYLAVFILIHAVVWGNINVVSAIDVLRKFYANESAISNAPTLLNRIVDVTQVWTVRYLVEHPIELMLAFFGMLAAFRRRRQEDILLLATLLLSLGLFLFMLTHPNPYYWIHNLPFIAVLAGAFLAEIAGAHKTVLNFAALAGMGAVVILLSANIHLTATRSQNADRLIEIGEEINAMLPEEIERVAGWQVYYFGLSDRQFVSTENFIDKPGEDWLRDWNVEPPQAIILTRGLDDMHQNIYDYISANGMAVAQCFESDSFGRETALYLPETYLPDGAPLHCR